MVEYKLFKTYSLTNNPLDVILFQDFTPRTIAALE